MIIVPPNDARAQIIAGAQVGYDTEVESPAMGLSGTFPITISDSNYLLGNPGFTYYFVNTEIDLYTIDFNVLYPITIDRMLVPFVGAGLGLQRWSASVPEASTDFPGFGTITTGGKTSTTNLLLNLQGGAQVELDGPFTPFFGLTVSVGGTDRLEVNGGIRYTFTNR